MPISGYKLLPTKCSVSSDLTAELINLIERDIASNLIESHKSDDFITLVVQSFCIQSMLCYHPMHVSIYIYRSGGCSIFPNIYMELERTIAFHLSSMRM